jgi:hypothetical protein
VQNSKLDIKKDEETSSLGYKYAEEFDKNKFSTRTEIIDIGIIERHERIVDVGKYVPDKNYQSLEDKVKDFRESLLGLGIRQGLQSTLRQESRVGNTSNAIDVLFRHVEKLPARKQEIERQQTLALPLPGSETEKQEQNINQRQYQCVVCTKPVRKGCSHCPHCGQKLNW